MRGQRLAEDDQQFVDAESHADSHAGADADFGAHSGPVSTAVATRAPVVVERRSGGVVAARRRALANQQARRVPFVYGSVVGVAGLGAWGAVEAAAAAAGQPALAGGIAVTTWIATGAGLPVLRWRLRDRTADGRIVVRVPRRHRRRWWVAATASALWVDLMASGAVHWIGPWGMAALLGVGATVVSAGWMRDHPVELLLAITRRALPPAPPPPAIEPPPPPVVSAPVAMDPASVLGRKWDARVAAGEKAVLAGAELIPIDVLPQAAKWIIDTDGDFTFDEIAAAQKKIAARLNILARNVIIERDGEQEGRALLTIVLIDSVLTEDLVYPGPSYDNGAIRVAKAADGTGWLYHYADDPDKGCRSGLFVGEPGAGKSAGLEVIVAAKRASGVWRILYADGDPGGGSSAVNNNLAHMALAGKEGALRVLEMLEAVIEIRSRLKPTLLINPATGLLERITDKARQKPNVREMHATRQYPGYCGVFDELYRVANDPWLKEQGFIPRLEEVVRIGRKYGVAVLVGTQSLLAKDFGLSTNLRSYLAARNAWILRSQNQSEATALNGVAGAASTLPELPGYCYAAGSKRMCLARIAWEEDLDRYAPQFPNTPGDQLSELAVALYQPTAVDPTAVLGERLQSIEEIEAALIAGRNPFITTQDRAGHDAAKTTDNPAPASQPAPAGQREQQVRRWSTPGGAAIPAPLTGATVTRLHPRPDPGSVPALTPKAERVRTLLWARPGPWTTAELEDATGLSKPDVSKALNQVLVPRGEAVRPTGKTGVYAGVLPARPTRATT